MTKKRNYKQEYKAYQGSEEQKKRRAARGRSRYKMIKAGRARVGDGLDVIHKSGNPNQTHMSNLGKQTPSQNRSFARTKTGGKVNATD